MKKILAILGAVSLTATGSSAVVACNSNKAATVDLKAIDSKAVELKTAQDVFSVKNMAYYAQELSASIIAKGSNVIFKWLNSSEDTIAIVVDKAEELTAKKLAYNGLGAEGGQGSILDFVDNAINIAFTTDLFKGNSFVGENKAYSLFTSGIENNDKVYENGTVFNITFKSSAKGIEEGIIKAEAEATTWKEASIKVQLVVDASQFPKAEKKLNKTLKSIRLF
ncbi:lipoprotein [Spiroplasma chrysopicola]|uniref:Lipoprotein n=1 Tax=Spiroplasma chrysopicola DF-1 TaxID=1276227 RepID=R4U3W2_9MOLU|nr:lipoprotein [Spiroplasma chrysopicola]AGM25198.1 hypothetical protein SCHRY_v1c06220 [Spiroplasma chrysopicola DF-1]